jgi:hypothetical protein
MDRQKWTTEKLPDGYPVKSKRKILQEVIQDLSEELVAKTKLGKSNEFWRFLILNHIQSGKDELQNRNNSLLAGVTLGGLAISLIAIFISIADFRSSANWEKNQIKILDKQTSVQVQILEIIKNSSEAE